MIRIKLFFGWFKLLRSKNYKFLPCIEYALYNSKYYTVDGKNRSYDKGTK
jgi:hypothetical protein